MSLNIVKDKNFQELFSKHFIYENGRFVYNEKIEAMEFCYGDNSYHDKMITDGYVFYICDEGVFTIYEKYIVFFDNESIAIYLGDNILTCLTFIEKRRSLTGVHNIVDFEIFKKRFTKMYGNMDDNSFSMDHKAFDEKYDLV